MRLSCTCLVVFPAYVANIAPFSATSALEFEPPCRCFVVVVVVVDGTSTPDNPCCSAEVKKYRNLTKRVKELDKKVKMETSVLMEKDAARERFVFIHFPFPQFSSSWKLFVAFALNDKTRSDVLFPAPCQVGCHRCRVTITE